MTIALINHRFSPGVVEMSQNTLGFSNRVAVMGEATVSGRTIAELKLKGGLTSGCAKLLGREDKAQRHRRELAKLPDLLLGRAKA